MEKLKTIMQFLLFGCFALFVMAGAKTLFNPAPNSKIQIIKQQDIDKAIEQRLLEMADSVNKTLPKMIDDKMQLDKVTVESLALVYHYTLIKQTEAFDEYVFKKSMRPLIIQRVCSDAQLQARKQDKLQRIFKYYDATGNFLTSISINRNNCQEQ